MRKKFMNSWFRKSFVVLTVLVTTSSLAFADDRFALAVGAHDTLVVFGPKGERVAQLPVPSISQPVTVGATSFQVSYGRDANNMLTAILAPNPSQPQDLHFNVLNKSVDTDKQAVVTLTFSPGINKVSVDPGYVGLVQVNSHSVKHREVADTYVPAPAPAPAKTDDVIPKGTPMVDDSAVIADVSPSAPMADASATYTLNSPSAPKQQQLFWSEPVTSPDGTVPPVATNQMKLVEVQGPVSIKTASGETKEGEEGMLIPSGATILTAPDSSAAVFMGGVNSARLLPNSEAQITQHLSGSVRNTTIDLHQGTVFSRVGHRPGETQDYEVRTPEGVAAARGTEFADYRGTYDDLLHSSHASNNSTPIHTSRLLAWNPISHGIISDVADSIMTAAIGGPAHYTFVAKGVVGLFIDGKPFTTLTGLNGDVGKASMPPTDDVDHVFNKVLTNLQPFNSKLQGVLARIHDGTASAGDLAFYNNLKNTFFDEFGPSFPYDPNHPNDFALPIASETGYHDAVYSPIVHPHDYGDPNPATDLLPGFRRASNQMLQPFGTCSLTPFGGFQESFSP
jgi:hypothetical protein